MQSIKIFNISNKIVKNKAKNFNSKKGGFRKTFVDPLNSNLPQCSRFGLKKLKVLTTKSINTFFLRHKALKELSINKPFFNKKDLLKTPLVLGQTLYSNKRNIFNYYGFYTPYVSANFELRWNRNIVKKPVDDISNFSQLQAYGNLNKSYMGGKFHDFDKHNLFKKLVKKARLSRDLTINLYRTSKKIDINNNSNLLYYPQNWYSTIPPSKLFKDPALWSCYQLLASRYVPTNYIYWFHRRLFSNEAKNIFDVYGSKYAKFISDPKFSSNIFNVNKEGQLNILKLRKSFKSNLRYYYVLKQRSNRVASFFIPFIFKYYFKQSRMKGLFKNFFNVNFYNNLVASILLKKTKNFVSFSNLLKNVYFLANSFSINNGASFNLVNTIKTESDVSMLRFNFGLKRNNPFVNKLRNLSSTSLLNFNSFNFLFSHKNAFNYNIFKASRFSVFNSYTKFSFLRSHHLSLPCFLHRQYAISKVYSYLSGFFAKYNKFNKSSKKWQLALAGLYKNYYLNTAKVLNVNTLLFSRQFTLNKAKKIPSNMSKFLSGVLNQRNFNAHNLSQSIYGKQHFYFRSSLFALLKRSLKKNNSIIYSISKGRRRKYSFSRYIFKPSHVNALDHATKPYFFEALSRLRSSNFMNFQSSQWKKELNLILDVVSTYIKKYKSLRIKLNSSVETSLSYSLKKEIFSIRWILLKLIPVITSLKKSILFLKNNAYTSSFKTSYIAIAFSKALQGFCNLNSKFIDSSFITSVILSQNYSLICKHSLDIHMLPQLDKILYVFKFLKGNKNYFKLFNNRVIMEYNSGLFPSCDSAKPFRNIHRFNINNLNKSNLLFNNKLNKFNTLTQTKQNTLANIDSRRYFNKILYNFISKSNFYSKKRIISKLSRYRRWNSLVLLHNIIKNNTSNNSSSQQLTVWLNTIGNFFAPQTKSFGSIFNVIDKTSIGKILPQQRYIVISNFNSEKDLYIKMVVDRPCFFVCHKSLSNLNISLIDTETGQSLNFLNNYSITFNLYRNVVIDILSSDNKNIYENRVTFFKTFVKDIKQNGSKIVFNPKTSFLKVASPKYTRFNHKLANSFFDASRINTDPIAITRGYADFYKNFGTLRVSVIKAPVFIRKIEPQQNNVISVLKNIMLQDIYRDKTNYLKLSWIKPDLSFDLPKWLFSNWDEESKQLFCWDLIVKLSVFRHNKFKNVSLISNVVKQNASVNSLALFKNKSKNDNKKDRKYKLDPVRRYYRGELPSESSIVGLLTNFSNSYIYPTSDVLKDALSYKNRYIINKLLKVFDTGNMLKSYSENDQLSYLKAALTLINKKKQILNTIKASSFNNINFNGYNKISTNKPINVSPFIVDKEPTLKFHLYRVEMPIKAFLQRMEVRQELLRNINKNADFRTNLKKIVSLKNAKSNNTRIIKSKIHALKESYKMLRRTENAFGLGMFRKSYKNSLWRKRLRNYTYRILNRNFKINIKSKAKKESSSYFERAIRFRQRSRWRWFKKTRRRELFPPTKIPKASKNSWTLSLRRFYKHKLIMRKYIFSALGNINYKQFYKIYNSVKHLQQNRIFSFINKIESRLDMFMLRLNFGKTAMSIHQLIRHGHVKVNHKTITFPQYQLRINDQISLLIPDKTHDYYNSMYKKSYIQNVFPSTLKNAPVMRLSIHAPARFFALLSIKKLLFFRYKRIHFDLLKKDGGQFSLTQKGFQLPLNNYLRLQFGFMYQLPVSFEALNGNLRLTNVVNYDVFTVLKYRNPR